MSFVLCLSAFVKNNLLRIIFYQVECGLFVMQMEDFVYDDRFIHLHSPCAVSKIP
ncbi:conserved hypothetical protein [Photorhabdus asymbiotica]|uniref:Uncharacterized protein n=1 Tax=Photorhabdus asymbiotica subsp. asymbiotica (strain ATCC 43949 / 3105-77) TaxID=553480 RepID=C7BJ97_PHOAA|nr:conserved hypothetical protein [Photorhabdus asymbiotica]